MTDLTKTYLMRIAGLQPEEPDSLRQRCSFPFKKTEEICPVREVEATEYAAATRPTGLAAGQAQAGATQR